MFSLILPSLSSKLSLQHSFGTKEPATEDGNSSVVARLEISDEKINRLQSNNSSNISQQEGILLQVILGNFVSNTLT